MLATLRAWENGISTLTTTAPTDSSGRNEERIGTAPRTTSPPPTSSTRQPDPPAIAACTSSLSGREKPAAGMSGLMPLTSSSPVALNTSTTPRLYSRCLECTRASRSARVSSRSSRSAVMRSAMRAPKKSALSAVDS